MKEKKYVIFACVFILLPIIIIFFTVFDMSSDPSVDIMDDVIGLKAPLCTKEVIDYKDIDDVQYIDSMDFGEKKKGKTSTDFIAGYYENDVYGDYYIVANQKCKNYIVICSDNRYFVFNLETDTKTKEAYQVILEKTE